MEAPRGARFASLASGLRQHRTDANAFSDCHFSPDLWTANVPVRSAKSCGSKCLPKRGAGDCPHGSRFAAFTAAQIALRCHVRLIVRATAPGVYEDPAAREASSFLPQPPKTSESWRSSFPRRARSWQVEPPRTQRPRRLRRTTHEIAPTLGPHRGLLQQNRPKLDIRLARTAQTQTAAPKDRRIAKQPERESVSGRSLTTH
jgi:hypothetical protein